VPRSRAHHRRSSWPPCVWPSVSAAGSGCVSEPISAGSPRSSVWPRWSPQWRPVSWWLPTPITTDHQHRRPALSRPDRGRPPAQGALTPPRRRLPPAGRRPHPPTRRQRLQPVQRGRHRQPAGLPGRHWRRVLLRRRPRRLAARVAVRGAIRRHHLLRLLRLVLRRLRLRRRSSTRPRSPPRCTQPTGASSRWTAPSRWAPRCSTPPR
jgi:hypothetical protein